MTKIISCNFEDSNRKKPIKLKKGKEADLKYLLYLIGVKRTYVLSCHTRTDQVMWFNGFQVFFKVKHVINIITNGAAFSTKSLQMLEEAHQKKTAIKNKDFKKNSRQQHLNLNIKSESPALDRPTSIVGLKSELETTKEINRARNQNTKKSETSSKEEQNNNKVDRSLT